MNKKLTVITITGKAQHGKDFTATILKELLEDKNLKILTLHYADYLKFICKNLYGWDGIKDKKGRATLQYIGTDKARKNNPNIWVNVVNELLLAIGEDFDIVLIPDARFPNEIDRLIELGWEVKTIKVNRLNFKSTLTEEQLEHYSETALDNYTFDYKFNYLTGKENIIYEIRGSGLLDNI